MSNEQVISLDHRVLVTGASGFIGTRVVASLLEHGFRRVRCLVRPSTDARSIEALGDQYRATASVEIVRGNLLSPEDCANAAAGVSVVYHLAVGGGGKSFPDAYIGAVLTTRNLVEACLQQRTFIRFVNVSSFAVYTNRNKSRRQVLDETSEVEPRPEFCGEAYCYAKTKQDELVREYAESHGLRYVILRPGVVYGPGKRQISGRVGLGTFGFFMHMGGANTIPFTYVDNCADAIVLAGLKTGIEGEVFNIVDDDLPTSRAFLRMYKKNVGGFRSLFVPRSASYMLCYLWEKGVSYSRGQLPLFVNRRAWRAYWKGSHYSNRKVKERLGWTPRVPTSEGMTRFFTSCRAKAAHA